MKKPMPAINALPNWWKDMPRFNSNLAKDEIEYGIPGGDKGTIRSCPAVNDAFNFGYLLFVPADIIIDTRDESAIYWKQPVLNEDCYKDDFLQDYVSFHPYEQIVGFKKDNQFHNHLLRINTMFGIKTDPGYSTFITHPLNRTDLPFRVVDAVIDTDKYVARSPYSIFFKKGFHGILKAGTPLIQAIPFKREDFSSEIVDFDFEDAKKNKTMIKMFMSNGYKKFKWSRKKFL